MNVDAILMIAITIGSIGFLLGYVIGGYIASKEKYYSDNWWI